MIPVYDLIKSQLDNVDTTVDLSETEKQELVQSIVNIDKTGSELVYCIIRSYEHEKNEDNTIPFNGKIQKSGIRFELDSFDTRLKHILKRFVEMHYSTV
jgi:hypothetical protein